MIQFRELTYYKKLSPQIWMKYYLKYGFLYKDSFCVSYDFYAREIYWIEIKLWDSV